MNVNFFEYLFGIMTWREIFTSDKFLEFIIVSVLHYERILRRRGGGTQQPTVT